MTEVVLTCSTEDARAIECTLLIWVLQVEVKTLRLAVVKWAVLMDYSHTGVVANTYPERGRPADLPSTDIADYIVLVKF